MKRKFIIACLVSFIATAGFAFFFRSPNAQISLAPTTIQWEVGKCYISSIPVNINNAFLNKGDTNNTPNYSKLELYEDGNLLGPAHSSHDEIRNLGNGKYSHWGNYIYFSSSDNSDPRQNAHTYTLSIPAQISPINYYIFFFSFFILIIILQLGISIVLQKQGAINIFFARSILTKSSFKSLISKIQSLYQPDKLAENLKLCVNFKLAKNLALGIFTIVASILTYSFTLSAALPRPLLTATTSTVLGTSLVIIVACSLILSISNNWVKSLTFLVFLFFLFALPLNALWHHFIVYPNAIGGILPWSDAGMYYYDARRLLDGQVIGGSSRRPLFTGLVAGLLMVTGKNLLLTIAALVAINVFAVFLFAKETRDREGKFAAACLVILYFFYYRLPQVGGLGLIMTENLGLALGAIACTLFSYAARSINYKFLALAFFFLTLALCARAGSFFMLPFLLVSSALLFFDVTQQQYFRLRAIKFFILPLVACLLGFLADHSLRKLAGSPEAAFGNFSHTLYGLVTGGKGWTQAIIDHPNASPQELYTLSKQIFINNPIGAVKGSLEYWRDYFPSNSNHAYSFITNGKWHLFLQYSCYLFSLIGLIKAFFYNKNLFYPLAAIGVLGHLASIPFVPPNDAGVRVYAASMPMLFSLIVNGIGWIISSIFNFSLAFQKDRIRFFQKSNIISHSNARLTAVYGLIIIFFAIPIPLIGFAYSKTQNISYVPCEGGLETVYVKLDPMSWLNIVDDRQTTEAIENDNSVFSFETPITTNRSTTIKIRQVVRYIRVQLENHEYLNLAEFEANTLRDGIKINYALHKPTAQSSTILNGVSDNAVDGNISGNWEHGSIAHTDKDHQPWWEVDLKEPTYIDEVVLWSRENFPQRLQNAKIFSSLHSFQRDFGIPELPLGKLKAAVEKIEIKQESTKMQPSMMISNPYDINSGRYLWLIAPTISQLKPGLIKACGNYSDDPQGKNYGVFYANTLHQIAQ